MVHRFKPHTDAWFSALRKSAPRQALQTDEVINLAGTEEACGECGDTPFQDYELIKPLPADDAVVTFRLCVDCLTKRKSNGENFIPF